MNERVTVSLPMELVAEARRAVETGAAASVSSYIAAAVSAKAARQQANLSTGSLSRSQRTPARWEESSDLVMSWAPDNVARVTQQHHLDAEGLPPLPPSSAGPAERADAVMDRLVARLGGMPSLEDYRYAYASCGAPWPGDDVIRRRHRVAPAA